MSAVIVPIGSAFEIRVLNSIARAIINRIRAGQWPGVVLLHPDLLPSRREVFGIPILRSPRADPNVIYLARDRWRFWRGFDARPGWSGT